MCEKMHSESHSQDEQLIHNLRRCSHYLRHNTEEKGSQRRVLFMLHRRGPLSQKELLDIMGVRAGSMSELLSKLESKGFIAREKNAADKRNHNVSITPAGLEALAELQQQYYAAMANLLADFPNEDKAELNRLLEKLHATWQE